MGELVFGVHIGVVWGAGLDYFPEDFEQALAQAAQGAGVAHAFLPLFLVVGLGPRGGVPGAVGPEMHDVAQEFVALVAHLDFVDLPGLVADRAGAGQALEGLRLVEALRVGGDFAQEARGQEARGAGQGAEEAAVGMLLEEFFDLGAVFVQLALEQAQQAGQADGQQAFGGGDRRGTAEGLGTGEGFQRFFRRIRTPEFVFVQELFPAAAFAFEQDLGSGKLDDELPGRRPCPILKGLQGGGVVFAQGLLELVDQGGRLLDQADLVAAQEAQLLGQRVQGLERFPLAAVQTQGIGHGPGVEAIDFVAAGGFAFAIALGGHGVDGIDGQVDLQELIDGRALVGFDDNAQGGIGGDFLTEVLPAGQGVRDAELGDDLALGIDDDEVMVIAGPVEAGVVGELMPGIHVFSLGCMHRGAVVCRSDTRSLAGYCSLRHWDRRRGTDR